MTKFIKSVSLLLVLCIFADLGAFAGIPADKSVYIGGTSSIQKNAQGVLSTEDAKTLKFSAPGSAWEVEYGKISSLSYGQHAGRRVGATVALGVTTLGIGALPMLFSKKRRHYLTIEYTDANNTAQAAVFEVGKNAIRTLLTTLEVRSGKKVEYEDDEARKAGNK